MSESDYHPRPHADHEPPATESPSRIPVADQPPAPEEIVTASLMSESEGQASSPPATESLDAPTEVEFEFHRVAAVGGAVTSLVLGVWTFIACWFTPFAIINSLVGLGFGFWGLKSKRVRMAQIAIGVCIAATITCLIRANAM